MNANEMLGLAVLGAPFLTFALGYLLGHKHGYGLGHIDGLMHREGGRR